MGGGGGSMAAGSRVAGSGDLERTTPDRRVFPEQRLEAEAGIPIPAVGIEDPERDPPPRWAGAAARDDDIGGLPDDIPSEPDPRPAGKFQTDPGSLPDRGGHRAHEPGWLQGEQGDTRPPGKGGEPAEPIGEPGRPVRTRWQVHDEEVHGPPGQERSCDREALVGTGRGEDDEPLQPDAAGHGFHRVERRCEVQPGDNRPARLGFRNKPECERGSAARKVSAQREAHPARQSAGPEDGVQGRKAGGVDTGEIRGRLRDRQCGRHRERPHHHPDGGSVPGGARRGGARRGRSPARLKGREGRRHVRGKDRHQMLSIEHLFE